MNKGVYIHFPFCEKKCNYCDFYSVANTSRKSEYIDALCREIKAYKGIAVDTVYFGGGTPSLMSVDQLEKLLDAVYTTFEVDKNAEITLEANPMSIGVSEKLKDFKTAGINRLSLGVQSFSDAELKELGRGHTARDAVDTVKTAQAAGFDNISIDLMFAIPHQTLDSFNESLDTVLSLDVQHVSAYALSVEDKTVFGVRQKRGENLFLPNEETEAEMYFSACDRLSQAGFEHYEISNFAKKGFRSRHNMKYWQGEEYIGIGASAHSYFEGVRYSMPSDISAFCKEAKHLDSYTNTSADRIEEFIFLSLRLSDGLDLERLEKMYGIRITPEFEKTAKELATEGLCKYEQSSLSLTEKGFFVSNAIIVKILDSLKIFS